MASLLGRLRASQPRRSTRRRRSTPTSRGTSARSETYPSPLPSRRALRIGLRSPMPAAQIASGTDGDPVEEELAAVEGILVPAPARPTMVVPSAQDDDAEWTHGDVTLVSTDGVRFKVPGYYLFAASGVFRGMREVGAPGPVELCGRGEDAAVVRDFLSLASGKPVGELSPRLRRERRVARFLVKYECDALLRTLLAAVRQGLARAPTDPRAVSPIHAWILAAIVDDPTTAAAALDVRVVWTWMPLAMPLGAAPPPPLADLERVSYDLRRGAAMRPVFDPSTWPLALFTHVPPRYVCALARAYGRVRRDGATLSAAFLRFLELE